MNVLLLATLATPVAYYSDDSDYYSSPNVPAHEEAEGSDFVHRQVDRSCFPRSVLHIVRLVRVRGRVKVRVRVVVGVRVGVREVALDLRQVVVQPLEAELVLVLEHLVRRVIVSRGIVSRAIVGRAGTGARAPG